ncbi:MAG TPA: phosphotransferase, partial [Actinomycetes bacterium]|nr:phosphotransferase [Actinomycetes bacterium]
MGLLDREVLMVVHRAGEPRASAPPTSPAIPQPRSHVPDPRTAGPALAAAFGWPDAPCSVLHAKMAPGTAGTILYRLGDRLVLVGHATEESRTGRAVPALGLHAWEFPDDPALPRLGEVLSSSGMAAALQAGLAQCWDAVRVRHTRAELVRYRPGRRATLRVEAWLQEGPGRTLHREVYFAKIYHDAEKAAAVNTVMEALERSEPVRAGRVRVAPTVAFLPDVPMIVQAPVPGRPLDLLLDRAARPDRRAAPAVLAAASALAAVHEVPPSAGRPRQPAREAARMEARSDAVATADPDLGAEMASVARRLLSVVDGLPAVVGGVHGDCKPSQFLVGDGVPALLDFDHAGPGDPAADVGGFAASLTQLAVWRSVTARHSSTTAEDSRGWLADLREQFIGEYVAQAAPTPELDQRLVYQEAAALLRKAQRAFARSPRSPMPSGLTAAARDRLSEGRG